MAAIRPAISSVYHLPGCGTLIVLVEPRFKSDGEMRAPNWPIFLVHFPLTPLGKGCELRDFRTMDAHFPVHRLPGRQTTDRLPPTPCHGNQLQGADNATAAAAPFWDLPGLRLFSPMRPGSEVLSSSRAQTRPRLFSWDKHRIHIEMPNYFRRRGWLVPEKGILRSHLWHGAMRCQQNWSPKRSPLGHTLVNS